MRTAAQLHRCIANMEMTVTVSACLQLEFATAFHRLCGKKVLFPQGFHCTGMPIKVPKFHSWAITSLYHVFTSHLFLVISFSFYNSQSGVALISFPCLSASQYIAALAAILQTSNVSVWEFCNKAPVCRK